MTIALSRTVGFSECEFLNQWQLAPSFPSPTEALCFPITTHSEPQAMCYIETSNLDGETNLKIRQVSSAVCQLIVTALSYVFKTL